MAQENENANEKVHTSGIHVNGTMYVEPVITKQYLTYPLPKHEFEELLKNDGTFKLFGDASLGAVIGLFVNCGAKKLGSLIDKDIHFDNWEFFAFFIALVVMLVCYFIHWVCPSKKKRLKKEIITEYNKEI